MGRQTAKDAYLALLEASSGKTESEAQDATLDLIDIIADMVESGNTKTLVSTIVSTPDTINGTGAETDAPGTITIPT